MQSRYLYKLPPDHVHDVWKTIFMPGGAVFRRKLRKSGNSIVLAIPREILEVHGWKAGDELILWVKNSIVFIGDVNMVSGRGGLEYTQK